MPVFEPGMCDDCGSYMSTITCNPPQTGICNTFGNCVLEGDMLPFNTPPNVPIKTPLKGTSVSPWVRLRFESDVAPWSTGTDPVKVAPSFWDYTEITTGNISQPGCANPSNKRPKAGISREQFSANPNNPAFYESCDERCRAAIKSFQYSWGSIDSGNKCKVTIVDELGSSLNQWIGRLFRNPTNTPMTGLANAKATNSMTDTTAQGVYKMKVTFGWLVLGGEEGNDCPVDGSFYGSASCTSSPPGTSGTWSSKPARLLCSPPLWFLPSQLNVNVTGGKYIYEIEGVDLMQFAQQNTSARVHGSDANKMHFAVAVKQMLSEANPPMDVDFVQLSPDGNTLEPLLFSVPRNTANIPDVSTTTPLIQGGTNLSDQTCLPVNIKIQDIPKTGGPVGSTIPSTGPQCKVGYQRAWERLGPLRTWQCNEQTPIQILHNWIREGVVAQGYPNASLPRIPDRGLIINYDPTYQREVEYEVGGPMTKIVTKKFIGKVLIWANPFPTCANVFNNSDFIKAVYIVNGGKCSPVLSFNPVMKWNFQALAASAGGIATTATGRMASTSDARQQLMCRLGGRGDRIQPVMGAGLANESPKSSGDRAALASVAHRQANLLHHPVEAELRVQGDPSDWLCSPIFGLGRTVALVVINPFFIDGDATNGCAVSWKNLTTSSCHSILTNKYWFIQGVDHQIKEGSYVTTYKLFLPATNAEINPVTTAGTPIAMGGGDDSTPLTSGNPRFACIQGTIPCQQFDDTISPFGSRGEVAYIAGPVGTLYGANTFCSANCQESIGPV